MSGGSRAQSRYRGAVEALAAWVRRLRERGGFLALAILTVLCAANLVLVGVTIYAFFAADVGYDWLIFQEAGRRAFSATLYTWEGTYAWSYSPLLAYVFALLAPIGFVGWSLLHVGVLGILRDRWLAALTLASWPWWVDLYNGNTMTFVFVAAAGALRNVPVGTGTYLLLCLLMPRPVMVPLMLWILWTQPAWRLRFAILIAANAVLVMASGHAGAWLDALLRVTDAVSVSTRDIGPGVLLGAWWLPLGVVLAAVFTIRGRIGLASLAASPYWLPQYLLMLMLEFVPRRSHDEPRPLEATTASRSDAQH